MECSAMGLGMGAATEHAIVFGERNG